MYCCFSLDKVFHATDKNIPLGTLPIILSEPQVYLHSCGYNPIVNATPVVE